MCSEDGKAGMSQEDAKENPILEQADSLAGPSVSTIILRPRQMNPTDYSDTTGIGPASDNPDGQNDAAMTEQHDAKNTRPHESELSQGSQLEDEILSPHLNMKRIELPLQYMSLRVKRVVNVIEEVQQDSRNYAELYAVAQLPKLIEDFPTAKWIRPDAQVGYVKGLARNEMAKSRRPAFFYVDLPKTAPEPSLTLGSWRDTRSQLQLFTMGLNVLAQTQSEWTKTFGFPDPRPYGNIEGKLSKGWLRTVATPHTFSDGVDMSRLGLNPASETPEDFYEPTTRALENCGLEGSIKATDISFSQPPEDANSSDQSGQMEEENPHASPILRVLPIPEHQSLVLLHLQNGLPTDPKIKEMREGLVIKTAPDVTEDRYIPPSELAVEAYRQRYHQPSAESAAQGASRQHTSMRLRYVIIPAVTDQAILDIVKELFIHRVPDSRTERYSIPVVMADGIGKRGVENFDGYEAALVLGLMGVPTVRMAFEMVTDHYFELREKSVTSIHITVPKDPEVWEGLTIVLELAKPPRPKPWWLKPSQPKSKNKSVFLLESEGSAAEG